MGYEGGVAFADNGEEGLFDQFFAGVAGDFNHHEVGPFEQERVGGVACTVFVEVVFPPGKEPERDFLLVQFGLQLGDGPVYLVGGGFVHAADQVRGAVNGGVAGSYEEPGHFDRHLH